MASALQAQTQPGVTYLQQLEALASEIQTAIGAISGNALSTLEASIARQEMLCAGLASSQQPLPAALDASVANRINSTSSAIRNLNLQYAALLKHSGRSIALLSALCKTHTGQAQEARGARQKHQTWSCEM